MNQRIEVSKDGVRYYDVAELQRRGVDMTFTFWRSAQGSLGNGSSPSAVSQPDRARVASERGGRTDTGSVTEISDPSAIHGKALQIADGGSVCFSIPSAELPAGSYSVRMRYRGGPGKVVVRQNSQAVETINVLAKSGDGYTGGGQINGNVFETLAGCVAIAGIDTEICIEANGGQLTFDELYLVTDQADLNAVSNIWLWCLDDTKYPPSTSGQGLILLSSASPLWGTSDAVSVTDIEAIGNQAWRVGEDSGTSETVAATLGTADAGTYQVLLRYRFEGADAGNAALKIDQSGQPQKTVSIGAVAASSTYDGTESYSGQSGYYALGAVTLVQGAATFTIEGPATTADAIFFDQIVLVPVLQDTHYIRTVNGTVRVVDKTRSGTPRQMQPGRHWSFNGVSDRVTAPVASLTYPYTMTVWVRRANLDRHAVISVCADDSSVYYQAIGFNGSNVEVFRRDGGTGHHVTGTNGGSLNGVWQSVVAVFDSATTIRVFIDGVLVETFTVPVTQVSNDPAVAIGTYRKANPGLHYSGHLGDPRVYGRALAADEIGRIAAMKPGCVDTGPTDALIWFKGDEGYECSRAFNSGSLGAAGDGQINAASITSFHDEATNDQYSFQNELGHSNAPVLDATGYPAWDSLLVGKSSLTGEFELNMWAERWAAGSEVFIGVTKDDADRSGSTYRVISSDGYGFRIGGGSGIQVRYEDAIQFTHASSGLHKLTVKRDVANVLTFFIDDLLVHTKPDAVSEALYFAMGSTALPSRGLPYWTLRHNGVRLDPWDEARTKYGGKIAASISIPRDESSPTQDVLGNPLKYQGQCPRDPVLLSPCLTTNGTSDCVSLNSTGLDLSTEDVTVAVFARTTATTLQTFFTLRAGTSSLFEHLILIANIASAGDLTARMSGANVTVSNSGFNDGEWHWVVVTKTGNTLRIYLDGAELKSGTVAAPTSGNADMRLGCNGGGGSPNGQFFAGAFGRLVVWQDFAASAQEVAALPDIMFGSPMLIWKLASKGDYDDATQNGNNGMPTIASEATAWANQQDRFDTLVRDGAALATKYSGSGQYYRNASRLTSGSMSQLSVAMWICPDGAGDRLLASEDSSSTRIWRFYLQGTNRLRVSLSDDGTNVKDYQGATVLSSNRWYHVAFTFGNNVLKLFVDGVEEASSVLTERVVNQLHNAAVAFELASYANGSLPFAGTISSVVVAQTEWSASQLAAIKNGSVPDTAWYFRDGDGADVQRNVDLTKHGAPLQRVVPAGVIPINIGPGVLLPGQSLDLSGGEPNSPAAQRLADYLGDLIYHQGDDDEGDALFARSTSRGDDRIIARVPPSGCATKALRDYTE